MRREPGVCVTAEKRVTANDFGMQHNPGGGFSEILLVEFCAQTAGLLMGDDHIGQQAQLCAIRDFIFTRRIKAGDLLTVEVTPEGLLGNMLSAACRVTCGSEPCATGRLILAFQAPY